LFVDQFVFCNGELFYFVAIEGWTVLVSGIKEDAEEIDLHDAFSEFGCVKDLHYNLDRRTGFGKVNYVALLQDASNNCFSFYLLQSAISEPETNTQRTLY
jgi:hypothetical protein